MKMRKSNKMRCVLFIALLYSWLGAFSQGQSEITSNTILSDSAHYINTATDMSNPKIGEFGSITSPTCWHLKYTSNPKRIKFWFDVFGLERNELEWSSSARLIKKITEEKCHIYAVVDGGKQVFTIVELKDGKWMIHDPMKLLSIKKEIEEKPTSPKVVNKGKHATFMNIPINGTLSSFVSKLKAKGFKLQGQNEKTSILSGRFAGESATISVMSTAKTHTVYVVCVTMGECSSWKMLKNDYFKYKKMYTSKYGKPKMEDENFKEPYYDGDGYELQALEKGKCSYSSYFRCDNCDIYVSISGDSHCVKIFYTDDDNYDKSKRESEETTLDDI